MLLFWIEVTQVTVFLGVKSANILLAFRGVLLNSFWIIIGSGACCHLFLSLPFFQAVLHPVLMYMQLSWMH